MSNLNDFVIENGVLKEYTGSNEHVVVPDGVTSIGHGAFANCRNLTSVDLLEGVTSIEMDAFQDCVSLENIKLPMSLKYIAFRSFDGCSSLTKIDIPEGVTRIGPDAFSDCSSLIKIDLPESVTIIEHDTFRNCSSLTSIKLSKNIKYISSGSFENCGSLTGIVLPDEVKEIQHFAFHGCSSLTELSFSKNIIEIGDNAFSECTSLKSVSFSADSDVAIGYMAFAGCTNLQKVMLPLKVSLQNNSFPDGVKATISGEFYKTREKINIHVARIIPISDAEDYAYAWLFQSGKPWRGLLGSYDHIDPNEVVDYFGKLLMNDDAKISATRLKNIVEFIEFYQTGIKAETIKSLIENLNQKHNYAEKTIMKSEIVAAILSSVSSGNPIDEIVLKHYEKGSAFREKSAAVAKKGLPYADGSGTSSREAVSVFLEGYMEKWEQLSCKEDGEMSAMRQLGTIAEFDPPQISDKIASVFDKQELSNFLEKLVNGNSYREFTLAYARWATCDSIERTICKIRVSAKGRAKERYWAENLREALYLSDTQPAVEFIEKDKKGDFERYVRLRGYESETDYRDTVMLSDFGFDADGIKRYDIGGNVIEVSLDGKLSPVLYDTANKKALKSFPKKSEDPERAAACAEDYAQLKKDIKDFYKKRREYMLQLYMKNEKISFDVWNKIYCNHPLLKRLTEMVIWQDENSVEFMVKDGKCFAVKGEEYVPDTKISPAHVLDMTEQDIRDWQNYLATTKTKLLIDQVWEPVVRMDENMRNRYDGYVITAKDRNALKKELKDKGIDVRAERYGGDFNHRAGQYEFDPEADMILGNCAKLHYVVDEQSGDLTLGTLSTYEKRGGKRELNAVIHALDKASVKAGIAADRAELLTKDLLESFTAAQIIDFVSFAAEKKSSNCTAILLEYKNSQFETFDATDEFTLDF